MKCLWVSTSRNFKINPFFSRDALEATKGATKRLLRRNNFNYIPDTNRYWCSFRFPKIALFPEFSAILFRRRRGYFTYSILLFKHAVYYTWFLRKSSEYFRRLCSFFGKSAMILGKNSSLRDYGLSRNKSKWLQGTTDELTALLSRIFSRIVSDLKKVRIMF